MWVLLRLSSLVLILIYSLQFDLQTKESSNNEDAARSDAISIAEPELSYEDSALSDTEPAPESENAIPEVSAEG